MNELEVFRIWIYREGHMMLSWWLLATFAGAAAWPLMFRLLRRLPDRGYTLARPAGMLMTGFVLWLLASLGFLRNDTGGMVLAWVIVLALGVVGYVALRCRDDTDAELGAWLRENWRVVLAGELVFAALFFGWAIVRAYDPNIAATEKPMEMAFINAIRRSETFPPNDPWMSGYAISYYYFGYVMIAALAELSGVVSGVAFNLAVALFFALTGAAAYGVVFNLVRSRTQARQMGRGAKKIALFAALLGPLFVVIMGNLGGVVQLTWSQQILPEDAYQWLDTPTYNESYPEQTIPHREWRHWWWWQSSRVLHDRNLDGVTVGEVIDEFPFFSFLLGDVHPHVLALPFSLMALGLALNLVLSREPLDRYQLAFYALVLGGLIFLNLLDGPLYMVFMVGAEVLRRLIVREDRLYRYDWVETVVFAVSIGVLGVLFYLPFFLGFRSQAGGLIGNPLFPTRFRQFFVMFAPLLVMVAFFLLAEWWRGRGCMNWDFAVSLGAAVLVGLLVAMGLLGLVAIIDPSPEVRRVVRDVVAEEGSEIQAFTSVIVRRLSYGLTSLVLGGFVVVVVARVFGRQRVPADGEQDMLPQPAGWAVPILLISALTMLLLTVAMASRGVSVLALFFALLASLLVAVLVYAVVHWLMSTSRRSDPPTRGRAPATFSAESGFVLLLVGAGAALTLLPDYLYVLDNFQTRMNTIFKFYYQAWAMWGIASAYAVYSILGEWAANTNARFPTPLAILRWAARAVFAAVVLVALAANEFAKGLLIALPLIVVYVVIERVVSFAITIFETDEPVKVGPLAVQQIFAAATTILVAAGLVYPAAGVLTETSYFRGIARVELDAIGREVVSITHPALDGTSTMFSLPDDEAAIACLSAYETGDDAVLVEAVGAQYSQYTRAATLSGISNVLGWEGHESQWRGRTYGRIAGSRSADIAQLYSVLDMTMAQPVIDRYGIDYIFVGTLERRNFGVTGGLDKFEQLPAICQYGDSVVYLTNREGE